MNRLKHRRRRRGRGARMTSAGASSESEWLVSRVLDVGEFRDCDGRPIGEGKVPKERRPRGVPFELRPCPYPGRRSEVQPDRPMNVSAMTRLVSTFPEALGALVIFREEYCRRFQIAQLSLFDLWRAKRRRLSTFQRTSLARCLPLAAAARRPRAVPRWTHETAVRHCHWRTALRPYDRQNKQDPLPHGQVSPCRSFRPIVSLALAQHC